MFKRKMAEQSAKGEDKSSLTPNSLVLASSSIQFSPDLSLPPLTTVPIEATSSSSSGAVDPLEDLDGVPIPAYKPLPVPVSVRHLYCHNQSMLCLLLFSFSCGLYEKKIFLTFENGKQ